MLFLLRAAVIFRGSSVLDVEVVYLSFLAQLLYIL